MAQFLSKSPTSACLTCGKPVITRSTKGQGHTGYCSRVCASMKRYEKRYTGARSETYSNPVNSERKRHE